MSAALDLYGQALGQPGVPLILRRANGSAGPAGLERWIGPVTAADDRVLERARGPVLDVGCGPGRHVQALAHRGVLALGVDVSPHATTLARGRGVRVLERSVFERLPGAGHWRSALLLDGSIGIGGRPAALLTRVAELLCVGGDALVELEPPGSGIEADRFRLERGAEASAWFDWARVAVDAIQGPATATGFDVAERWCDDERWFARLRRRCG